MIGGRPMILPKLIILLFFFGGIGFILYGIKVEYERRVKK